MSGLCFCSYKCSIRYPEGRLLSLRTKLAHLNKDLDERDRYNRSRQELPQELLESILWTTRGFKAEDVASTELPLPMPPFEVNTASVQGCNDDTNQWPHELSGTPTDKQIECMFNQCSQR